MTDIVAWKDSGCSGFINRAQMLYCCCLWHRVSQILPVPISSKSSYQSQWDICLFTERGQALGYLRITQSQTHFLQDPNCLIKSISWEFGGSALLPYLLHPL